MAKTKADLEKEIKELKQKNKELSCRLDDSNKAYNDLMQKYNELNAQKGDINGMKQLTVENNRLEMLYHSAMDSLKHEQKMHERTRMELNSIKNSGNIDTKRSKGRPKKEVHADITEIRTRMEHGETAEQIAESLGISRMTLFRRLSSNKNK